MSNINDFVKNNLHLTTKEVMTHCNTDRSTANHALVTERLKASVLRTGHQYIELTKKWPTEAQRRLKQCIREELSPLDTQRVLFTAGFLATRHAIYSRTKRIVYPSIKPSSTHTPAIIPCLRCKKMFKSFDKKKNRFCCAPPAHDGYLGEPDEEYQVAL